MTAAIPRWVLCPSCSKRYKWRPSAVGRRAGCPCGARFSVPGADGSPEEPLPLLEEAPARPAPARAVAPAAAAPAEDLYELAQELAPAATVALPAAALVAAALTLPPPPPRLHAAADAEADDESDVPPRPDPSREPLATFGNLYLPLVLLVAGFAANLVLAQWLTESFGIGLLYALAMAAVQVFVFLPLAVVGLYMTARTLETEFGDLRIALVKLAAITLGTGAVADSVFIVLAGQLDFDIYLLGASFFVYMVLCGVPMAVLFRTELDETCMAVGLLTVPRVGLLFALGITLPQLFHA